MVATIRVFSQLDPAHEGYDVSAESMVRALFAAEARHFWHLTRNRLIAGRLRALGLAPGARLIELGCGSGGVANALAQAGYAVTAVDGHRSLLEIAAARPGPLTLWQHDLRLGTDGFPERDFDAAGLFDVIEHLDDPAAGLAAALRCVRPGGLLLGTVPALMGLWSNVDVAAGHKTRYSKRRLAALLAGVAGARLREVTYFNRVLVPLLWLRRLGARTASAAEVARDLSVPAAPINHALKAIVLAEHRLGPVLDRTPLPGSSLWFALQRQG
jgi:2-polyprenyl-3-methyl-5-hydroxy-6-metoxy-1,4-benzoquinol methylase